MRFATSILMILVSPLALAHGGAHTHDLFLNGLLHPFSGIDHLITWLALGGLVGAFMAWPRARIQVVAAVTGVGLLSWAGHTLLVGSPSLAFHIGLGIATGALLAAGFTVAYRLVQRTTIPS